MENNFLKSSFVRKARDSSRKQWDITKIKFEKLYKHESEVI